MQHLLAVVVGCNYEDNGRAHVPPLRGAENDARHMAGLLQSTPPPNGALSSLTVLLGAEASKVMGNVKMTGWFSTPGMASIIWLHY